VRLEQRRLAFTRRYVRPEAARLENDLLARLRVPAEPAFTTATDEELVDLLRGELVGRHALRDRHAVAAVSV
jgi:hypothetical protein